MDKTKLNTLLDRVYELEGLIHLALNRDDDTYRIAKLMADKGEAVSRALAEVEENAIPADAEAPEGPNPLAEVEELISYALEEETDTADAAGEKAEVSAESVAETLTEGVKENAAENVETPANVGQGVERATDSVESDAESKAEAPAARPVDKPAEKEEDKDEADAIVNGSPVTAIGTREPESEENGAAAPSQSGRKLKTLFSINDRFRFSRELFGGSTRRFDDSLNFLEMALDYNEVEDYFIEEVGMDPEDDTVKEFLEVLSKAFAD